MYLSTHIYIYRERERENPTSRCVGLSQRWTCKGGACGCHVWNSQNTLQRQIILVKAPNQSCDVNTQACSWSIRTEAYLGCGKMGSTLTGPLQESLILTD